MALSKEIILERLNHAKDRSQIELAVLHEEKVRFCTRKYLDDAKPAYLSRHLQKVRTKLPKDKAENYENELTFPLPINPVSDTIFSELSKVWDSDSRTIEGTFSQAGTKEDFELFLEETGFLKFFQKDVWEAYKTQPNCILTIDMPAEQAGYYPEPYINIIDVSKLAFQPELDKQGGIRSLVYYVTPELAVGIDDVYYRTFAKPDAAQDWQFQSETPHGLYWCPAVFLVQDNLDEGKFLKESPITGSLYDFEKLLFRMVSGENLEDYASYPIHLMRASTCDYVDNNGNSCQGGVVNIDSAIGLGTYACPACSGRNLNGAGSLYTLEALRKADGSESYDFDNAVRIISADVTSLDYKDKSIDGRKQAIIAACCGQSQAVLSGQAQNEKQIASIFQSREALIKKTQANFESAIKFCLDAIGTLRYGASYTGSVVDLGSTHYLLDDTEIQDRISKAIEDDAPQYQIAMMWDEYNHTKYKSNPRQLQRANIMKRLEPMPYLSTDQAITLYSAGKLTEEIFNLKYNFTTLVAKFEDRQGDIVDFGVLLPFSRKIEIIYNELLNYVRQQGQGQGV